MACVVGVGRRVLQGARAAARSRAVAGAVVAVTVLFLAVIAWTGGGMLR